MSRNRKLNRRDVRKLPGTDFIGNYTGHVQYSGPMTLADVWQRACGDKISYSNRLDALREALLMEEQHRKQFAVYQCTCCGRYHVGRCEVKNERVNGVSGGGRGGEVHPYQRDTTAGHCKSEFPSMHDAEVRTRLYPLYCTVCGLQFGFAKTSTELQGLCPTHAWLYGGRK